MGSLHWRDRHLFRGACLSIYFPGALLNLIGHLVQPPRRFRIADLNGQATALDNLVLYPDQQF
jgi:hypothetical protein